MSFSRRQLFRTGSTGVLALTGLTVGSDAIATPTRPSLPSPAPVDRRPSMRCHPAFDALERRHQVRLAIEAWDSATGQRLRHRSTERFPIMSVFKVLASSSLLRDHDADGHVLDDTVLVRTTDIVANSPIVSGYVGRRLSYAQLCAAALRYSDNTAGNLILRRIGGPPAIARFARSLGDHRTRLDRNEPTLNTAIPGDRRDTTTAADLTDDLARLLLGTALPSAARKRLTGWMLGNTTSGERFRAVLPKGWTLADKTGSGDYGSANDVGVFFRPNGSAIVLSALSTKGVADADYDNDVLAEAAQIVLTAFC